ncbi:MAG: hypothetical protein RIQ78_440 [Bacteroidota bacterium]
MNPNVSLPPFEGKSELLKSNQPCFIEVISHFSSAVEQLIRNQQVEGSNPLSGSMKFLE